MNSSIGERPDELRASLSFEAHLWISDLEAWNRDAAQRLLTPDELGRARTLRHPDAQRNFLAGRALVRVALAHYAALEPSAWTFSPSRFGRPEITGPEPVGGLRFNLTHTRGLAACVVTSDADCGIDVEKIDRPLKPLRIAEHSFAPEEFRDLRDLPVAELRARFFSYWTLKEAYYKARGSGIPFRLHGARFELTDNGGVVFAPAADEAARVQDWQFALFQPTAEHLLAVALESGAERTLALRCFADSSAGTVTRFSPLELPPLREDEALRV